MIIFWVVAGVLSAAAAGFILQRASKAARTPEPADPALGLYRRQLDEIDDLAGRGLLPEDERRTAHAEAARRLLGAAERTGEAWTTTPPPRWSLAFIILAPVAALALYIFMGAPGTPDQPYAARLEAWRKADPRSLGPGEMVAVVEALVAEQPKDPEALRYLAMAEAAAGNGPGAVRALQKAVNLSPERAELWEGLGEAMVLAAEGEVNDDAKQVFAEALKRNPKAMAARFHLARAQIAEGHKDEGLAALKALSAELPADDGHQPVLKATIARVEGGPEPGAVGMDAIRGMVANLAARLQESPDDPEGWVRLVRSYSVLGETEKRDAALKTAQARYAKDPKVLEALTDAAATEPMR
jgi:cytochrome c-type biogenesis protein CcmH